MVEVNTERRFAELERLVKLQGNQIATLQAENTALKKLVNNHASIINSTSKTVNQLDKNLRNEVNRIAAAFKKVQALLSRNGGGPG